MLIRHPSQQALEQRLRAHAARELLILEQVRQLRAGRQAQEPRLQVRVQRGVGGGAGGPQDVAPGVLCVWDRDAVVEGAEEGGVDGGVWVEGVAEAVEGAACAWCGEVRADGGFDCWFVGAGGGGVGGLGWVGHFSFFRGRMYVCYVGCAWTRWAVVLAQR